MDLQAKTPRKRVANFTNDEKALLAQLIKNKPVIESKLTDGKSIAKKQAAWESVTREFNCHASVNKRETITLKRAWDNMKAWTRKTRATERGNLIRTGGGPQPSPSSSQDGALISMVEDAAPVMICEIHNTFDSDGAVLSTIESKKIELSINNGTQGLIKADSYDIESEEEKIDLTTAAITEPQTVDLDINIEPTVNKHATLNSQDQIRRPADYIRREAVLRIKHLESKKKIETQILKTQKLDGDVVNICQQSVSRIITTVSTLIASKMKDHVKFPATEEGINTVKQNFYDIAYFPGVIGCIDCTHIKIRSPGGISSEVYRNRKGWFSVNVQAVTGPNLEFYDLVVRWPGSTHDSFIYNSSAIKQRLNTGVLQGMLLGDSGYAVSDVLLTPFLSPNSTAQENYNKSHIKTRNTIERCFGVWKRRFPCLQVGMGIKKETVIAVICACAALHNIGLVVDNLFPSSWDCEDFDDVVDVPPMTETPNNNGFMVRQSIVDRFFQ